MVVLMALALAVSRSRSAHGSTEAVPADERTRPDTPSSHHAGFASVSALAGRNPPATQQTKDARGASLEFPEAWPRYLDAYLKDFLGANRGQEGDAITSIRASHPHLTRKRIWSRIVYLSLTNRKRAPYQKHEWGAQEDAILRSEYGQSRASSTRAIGKILTMHPDWSRDAIAWHARTLGLAQRRARSHERWSSTLDHYLLSLMDCQLDTIARRLRRSQKSILARLRRLGWTAEFFGGFKTKDLVLDLRVPEATVNDWVRRAWLQRKRGRITEESLRSLCRQHPEEIPFETLAPEARSWLRLSMDYGRSTVTRRGGQRSTN